nr:energy transducer TonB [Solitalea agri]
MKKAILSGKCQYWFDNGELKEVVNYYENKFDGTVSTYYKGGQLKRKDIYKLDSLVEGHCYDSTGAEKNHTVFHKRPEFPGGTNTLLNFLSRNLKYPSVSRRLGIEGKVLVQFVVNPNGQIINARIKQGLTTDLDTEALRVVNSLPSWEPGIHDGEKVNFNYLLPIVFRLQ